MGKKKGAKKGGANDFWDEAGEPIENNNTAADDVLDDPPKKSNHKNPFAAMSLDDNGDDDGGNDDQSNSSSNKNKASKPSAAPAPDDDDDDEFGGLMGALKQSAKKGKKDKKKKKNDYDFDDLGEDIGGNANGDDLDSKAPVQVSADDLMDDEFPEQPKKGKKGGQKKQQQKQEDDDNDNDASQPPAAEEADAPRILTKKEKEKLKKEKEKEKKKAQAAAKKAAAAASPSVPGTPEPEKEAPPSPAPAAAGGEDDDDDDAAEGGAAASDKKKKKKKKKAAEPAAPAPAPTKKPNAAVAALQARIAAQRKAEEEARLAEEEARRLEEEAERKEKEEAERKEAERQRKREKEKAKKEQLKKEGKLLTPKQKAEKAAAEARLQAMLKSGQIKVEGLEQQKEAQPADAPKKRVVIDNRKKKKPAQKRDGGLTVPEPVAAPAAKDDKPAEEAAPAPAAEAAPAEDEDVKDSWDAESDEDVKDSWDAESEDEQEKEAKKAVEAKPANGKAAAAAPAAAPAANGKKAAADKQPQAQQHRKQKAKADESDDDDESDESDESDDDDDSESESESDDGLTSTEKALAKRKAEAAARRQERTKQALAARSKDNLRSPICCILGHVDTGKTKLLDKIRQTNVQEGEAGGITQQIGATYFPVETLQSKTAVLDKDQPFEYKVPGLLVIDTPGHESFTNLRTRGSSLCNIAILVIDIMHGLENQTRESIKLLRDKKTPFVVALNKIDRLYGWNATPNGAFRDSFGKQNRATQNEFLERTRKIIVQLAEEGLNACLFHENKNMSRNVSLVPTSAHTGEGIPDMLRLIVELTQTRMSDKLMYLSELECTVLEVKVIEGLGTTIDVVLSNGVMHEGDRIVVCGLNGPIVTQVRALLTPQPLKEMRVKGAYVHHKMVKAALGVKIAAPDLEKAISGSRLLVVGPDDDEEELKDEVMSDLTDLLDKIDTSGRGVCVQASTLGSLEALLEFLKVSKIPVGGINIGPVYRKDVMRCATMLEKAKEFAVILAFDVPVDKEAEKLAEEFGIKIFTAKIIYHLENDFVRYNQEILEAKKREASGTAVWPCRLRTIACFAKRDPIILGCDIVEGSLRVGTPLAVVKTDPATKKKQIIHLGKVTSLEINHKERETVTKKEVGAGVAVKIEHAVYESAKMYGRHFDEKDEIVSHISRASIDALKAHFWEGISTDEKRLIKKLKAELDIP
ncbi:eukaryotic translation initiation factor 5B [Thecaphora frezii]